MSFFCFLDRFRIVFGWRSFSKAFFPLSFFKIHKTSNGHSEQTLVVDSKNNGTVFRILSFDISPTTFINFHGSRGKKLPLLSLLDVKHFEFHAPKLIVENLSHTLVDPFVP